MLYSTLPHFTIMNIILNVFTISFVLSSFLFFLQIILVAIVNHFTLLTYCIFYIFCPFLSKLYCFLFYYFLLKRIFIYLFILIWFHLFPLFSFLFHCVLLLLSCLVYKPFLILVFLYLNLLFYSILFIYFKYVHFKYIFVLLCMFSSRYYSVLVSKNFSFFVHFLFQNMIFKLVNVIFFFCIKKKFYLTLLLL